MADRDESAGDHRSTLERTARDVADWPTGDNPGPSAIEQAITDPTRSVRRRRPTGDR